VVGKRLEHYEILEKIGAGGMGQVYRARDEKLNREVALKVLPEKFAANEDRLRRFLQEARAVAAMNHPNIVTIYSVEESGGTHFLTMELVKGTALTEHITEDGFPIAELLRMALPLVDALSAAHELGVVHRDLKPSNIMLGDADRLKVLDFGLATFVLTPAQKRESSSEVNTRTALTGEGMVVGTLPYMSPEQIEGKPVEPRSDLFSLGIVLYEMAAGRRPFHGDTNPALMSSILKDIPPPVSALNPSLPADLSRVIGRCLEKDPSRRYGTAREVYAALDALPRQPVSLPASGAAMPAAGATPAKGSFAHDLYISYAQLDNEAQLAGQEGWVSAFHRSLEVRVGQLLGKKPVIWRNLKLHGEDAPDERQAEHIPKSALLITLLSPRYVKSEWCQKELESFLEASRRTGGPKWGNHYRVFKVVKTPTPVASHPPEIQPLPGYEFFTVDPQSGRPRELDQIFGPEAQREYWARLDDLAHDIVEMLEKMEGSVEETTPANGPDSPVAPLSEKGAIYLAETTHDLREEHAAMRRDLQRHGYTILPDHSLPLVASELRPFVEGELGRARMSIHLVGQNYGVIPEGANDSVVALQNEMALTRAAGGGFQRVVWIPAESQAADERQREFRDSLRTDPRMQQHCELLETPFEDLKTVVHQILEPPVRKSAPRAPQELEGDDITRIYLICDQRDQEAAGALSDLLFERGYEVTLPVFEGDEAEVREDHEDNLRLCDGVLFYYGAGNELWLRRKLREAQKSAGLGRTDPIRAKGIWVAAPATAQKQRLRTREALVMSGTGEVSDAPLQPFFEAIGSAAAGG
jgi:serine/threonine protein kinase